MSAIDKLKNKSQELMGNAKQKIGEQTGDRHLKAKGGREETAGNLKQAGEKIKDAAT